MEKRTIFSQVEVRPSGELGVRLRKQIVENGNEVAGEFHRFVLQPDMPFEEAIAVVNASLAQIDAAPIDEAALDRVQRIRASENTPEVLAAWEEYRKAQRALSEANARYAEAVKQGRASAAVQAAEEEVKKAEGAMIAAYRETERVPRTPGGRGIDTRPEQPLD